MNPGISTACLYPMETEKSLEILCSLGFDTLELFFNSPGELSSPFVGELKAIASDSGADIVSVHPFSSSFESFMLFSDYKRRFNETIDLYCRFFEAAAGLGADILVIHGDRLPFRLEDEEYIERFGKLAERGMEYGIRVAQENVANHRSAYPELIEKMRLQLGELAFFVFDFKQAVRAGVDSLSMINAMGDRLIHVHVNDSTEHSDCLLPGQGNTDFLKAKNLIEDHGCQPKWITEVYRRCFGQYFELIQACEYLKKVLV